MDHAAVKGYKGFGMEGFTAKWYASLTRREMDRFKELARRVAGEVRAGARILEVAPGPGYFAIELAQLGAYRVTGLDISRTFVEIADRNASEAGIHVDFRHGNASAMPFADESFDFIVCQAAFKNFTEPVRALKEMYRVLAKGGRALIIDLRGDASMESIAEAVDSWDLSAVNSAITKLTFRFMLLKRARTKPEFERLLAQTKFEPAEIQENGISLEVTLQRGTV
jgi:ubiquinone/menaquinone biosynthesis C-methylase UbiE